MADLCIKLKNRLEATFSMPFDVSLSVIDGEEQYISFPSNSDEVFFSVKAYVHNQIRLVVEIAPQNNAGATLNDMAHADNSKRKIFFQYIDVLNSEKAKINFTVNNELISSATQWPGNWRFFKCRIDLIPIPEVNVEDDIVSLLSEWLIHGTALILSLLTVEDNEPYSCLTPEQEGEAKEIRSKRYERSRVNREICLAHKGYSCYVCGFNFLEKYGQLGKDYIEVHHTTPVSEMGDNYQIDIDRDLVPVCSNCHSMLHRKVPPYTIKQLKDIIAQNCVSVKSHSERMNVIQIYPEYRPNCVPLYSIKAACGVFLEAENDAKIEGWIDADAAGIHKHGDEYFIVQACGESMLPKIQDGAYCVFRAGGSVHRGDIVIAGIHDLDEDYNGRFTIKEFWQEFVMNEDGVRERKSVTLKPLNNNGKYPTFELDGDSGEGFGVFGVLVDIIEL